MISMWDGNEKNYEFGAEKAFLAAQNGTLGRCLEGEKVFWLVGPYAARPGHIYSRNGAIEFRRQSGLCEFHFDLAYATEEDVTPRGWELLRKYQEDHKDD